MERKEDLLEAQRYRRSQAAAAMFGTGPTHRPLLVPSAWTGPVLGLLVAAVLCAAGPVVDVVTQAPRAPSTVVPGEPAPGPAGDPAPGPAGEPAGQLSPERHPGAGPETAPDTPPPQPSQSPQPSDSEPATPQVSHARDHGAVEAAH